MEGLHVVAELERLPVRTDEGSNVRGHTRKVPRRTVEAIAILRTSGGDELLADLRDVSIHGCHVVVHGTTPRMGSFVALKLGTSRHVQGVVRWTGEHTAGIEFLRPLGADLEEWVDLISGNTGW